MRRDHPESAAKAAFVTTRWPLILAAAAAHSDEARDELVRLYWYPLYAFARRRGVGPEDAADAVQSFLARLFANGMLAGVEAEGGRFRNYLRVGLSRHLVSAHRHATRDLRRPPGGLVYRDAALAENRWIGEPADERTPEEVYDRLCARAILDRARERLRDEYAREGRAALFDHLSAFLDGRDATDAHAAAAARLGLAEGTIRNAVKPFRERFGHFLRQQVASTLDRPDHVEEELRHLLVALSS